MPLSLHDQDKIFRAEIPSARKVSLSYNKAIWECIARPNSQNYRLRIEFEFPPHFALRNPTAEYYPRVYVKEPLLVRDNSKLPHPLPHVWWDKLYKEEPNLCLFRSQDNEWNYDDPISSTTYLDASEWLYFYEIWRQTGEWHGGGVEHPEPEGSNDNGIEKIRRDAYAGTSKIALAA